jgi:hypothetical protein
MSNWSISIAGGEPVSLESVGVRSGTLVRTMLDEDTLTLSLAVEDGYADPPFAYLDRIKLYNGSTCRFIGQVVQVGVSIDRGEERIGVVCANDWWLLERIVYQQQMVLPAGVDLVAVYNPRVVMNQDFWGDVITTDFQLQAIINYANVQGGTSISLDLGSGTFLLPPLQEDNNVTCAEAIRKQCRWMPNAACWFDYSTGESILMIRLGGLSGSVTLDLDDKNLTSIGSLRSRKDLQPRGITIIYGTATRDGSGTLIPGQLLDVAGSSAGQGVMFINIPLANQGTDHAEDPPSGIAGLYYAALTASDNWEGSILKIERECSGFAHPGDRVDLLNGNASWATMNALVKTVSEDLAGGKTDLQLGFPDYLGFNDFVDLMRRMRVIAPAGSFAITNNNGSSGVNTDHGGPGPKPGDPSPVPNPDAGKPPGPAGLNAFEAEFCDGGTPVTRTVYGN